MESRQQRAPIRRYILSAIAGYVDGFSFLMLSGFFVNQVTGDVIVGAVSVVRGGSARSWVQLGMLPLFYLAVMAAAAIVLSRVANGKSDADLQATRALLVGQFGLLILFALLGVAFHSKPGPASALVTGFVGGTGVCAMACQAALTRIERFPESTTVMTTNTTQFAIDAARLLVGGSGLPDRQVVRQQALELGGVILSFFVGAVAGAALADHVHCWSLAVPVVAVGAMGLRAHRALRR